MDDKTVTFDDIRELIKESYTKYNRYRIEAHRPKENGLWPKDYVVDENLTVKENRRLVEMRNRTYTAACELYRKNLSQGFKNFRLDIISAIMQECNLNKQQAELISEYVRIRFDCMEDFCDKAESLCELITNIQNAGEAV